MCISRIVLDTIFDTDSLMYYLAGEVVKINEYMVGAKDEKGMVFLGAIKTLKGKKHYLLFLYTPTPVSKVDVKEICDHIYCVRSDECCEKYISDWLVENVYDNKFYTSYKRDVMNSDVSCDCH